METSERLIVPTAMASEWDELVAQINAVKDAATRIQIDVMDGQLVPSFSFPYNKTILDGQKIPYTDSIFYEAHLMVQHPQEVGHRFIHAGAKRIVPQIEGFRSGEAARVFQEWKDEGADVGVSIMLDTPLSEIRELIEGNIVSSVQVMSIARVGFQGEQFDERAFSKIEEIKERYEHVTISVDGGVNKETLQSLVHAGVTFFGVGSAVMKADNPITAFNELTYLLQTYA